MGTNYYLMRKVRYSSGENVPAQLGCGDVSEERVQILTNGYVWKYTYYPSEEELNKEFYQKIHIGKSSYGWYFALCVYPNYNIKNYDDWVELLKDPNNFVLDENGTAISMEDMIEIIACRCKKGWSKWNMNYEKDEVANANFNGSGKTYCNYDELLDDLNAVRGSNGLVSRKEDKYTSHSDGLYDYIISGNHEDDCIIFS